MFVQLHTSGEEDAKDVVWDRETCKAVTLRGQQLISVYFPKEQFCPCPYSEFCKIDWENTTVYSISKYIELSCETNYYFSHLKKNSST